MSDIRSLLKGQKSRKTAVVLAAAVLVYALAGFLVLPGVLRSQTVGILKEKLHRDATIREISVNPFMLSLTVNGFELKDPDGSAFVSFEQLVVDFELSSVFRRAYTFREIRLVSPFGRVQVHPDGSYNFSDLISREAGVEPSPEAGKSLNLPPVLIELLEFKGGKFVFSDQSQGRQSIAEFGPVEFTVRDFSTRPREGSVYSFAARTARGESIEWEGTFLLEPLGSEGKFSLGGIQLRPVWEYVKDRVGFEIHDGQISIASRYAWDRSRDLRLSAFAVDVKDLRIAEKSKEGILVSLPDFHIRDAGLDMANRQIRIPLIESSRARLVSIREPEGTLNLARIFAPAASSEPDQNPSVPGPEWKLSVNRVNLADYGIQLEDRVPEPPVILNLEPLTLELASFTYPPQKPLQVKLVSRINEAGELKLEGPVDLKPVSTEQEIELAGFPLSPLQPYIDPHLNLLVKSGAANAKGRLSFKVREGLPPLVSWDGAMSVSGFRSVDQRDQADFARWDRLAFEKVHYESTPAQLSLSEIRLEKPFARVIIRNDQSSNVVDIVKPSSESSSPAQPAAQKSPMKTSIRAVRFLDGSVNFSDYSLEPGFSIGIQQLEGSIQGLSSSRTGHAKVNLKGKVDRYAPVLITGEINPLSSTAYTDVTLSFQGIEVASFTPYSAKYAGYLIDKGKVFLDLRYRLNQRKLIGENKVMIDQFTFGERTDSPDATSLPVKLAVAILKDREGKIRIDLPVRGDLDDPEFRYGQVIWAAVKTLLEKITAAPFTALASLVVGAGGDQLSHIDFAPGTASVSEDESVKFETIGKLLADRPVLRIEVKGRADAGADVPALKEQKLFQRMRERRADELMSKSGTSGAVPDVVLSDTDRARILRKIYQERFQEPPRQVYEQLKLSSGSPDFPKESSGEGLQLVTEAIWKRLLDVQVVEPAVLRELAQARAASVQAGLVENGKIEPTRVFVREVEAVTATGDEPPPALVQTELLLTAD